MVFLFLFTYFARTAAPDAPSTAATGIIAPSFSGANAANHTISAGAATDDDAMPGGIPSRMLIFLCLRGATGATAIAASTVDVAIATDTRRGSARGFARGRCPFACSALAILAVCAPTVMATERLAVCDLYISRLRGNT